MRQPSASSWARTARCSSVSRSGIVQGIYPGASSKNRGIFFTSCSFSGRTASPYRSFALHIAAAGPPIFFENRAFFGTLSAAGSGYAGTVSFHYNINSFLHNLFRAGPVFSIRLRFLGRFVFLHRLVKNIVPDSLGGANILAFSTPDALHTIPLHLTIWYPATAPKAFWPPLCLSRS